MSVKTWFASFWSNISTKLRAFFEGPGGIVVRQALGTLLDQLGEAAISILLDVARSKVADLNPLPISNDKKREEALDYLRGYAVKAGMQVGESVLRYVLETAVQSVKGTK